ncbi:hypothetical protein Tco_0065743 [Tanacetum coccineum]
MQLATKNQFQIFDFQCFLQRYDGRTKMFLASTPTRTDEQIVPRSQWLIIGKSNLLFNAQKTQKNPIFHISVDILSNTNFFRAFTASTSIPAIYVQQFWNTMKYDEKTGVYSCQVDEQWFDLKWLDLIRKALAITHIDTAQLLWEGFTQGDQAFFSHKASHKASLKDPKKKVTPLLIPYGWFSKFVPKGETVEVFGMAIPDPLITEAIQQSSYYPKYLEMVAENTKKTPQESARTPAPTKKPSKRKPPQKIRKGKPSFQLVDEEEGEAHQQPEPQGEGDDPDLELAKKMSLDEHQEKREGGGTDADLEKAIKLSLDPSFLPRGQPPVGGVAIRDPVSETIPKLPEVVGKGKAKVTEEQAAHFLVDLSKKKKASAPKVDKEQGEVSSTIVTSRVGISVRTEDQAESDPGKAHEALAGPEPEPI